MFDTIAYCLGFTSSGLTPIENSTAPSFVTQETEDQWTLVDVNDSKSDGKGEVFEYPTPPPSPKLEKSWLITPPPCFNAEGNQPLGEQNVRENLLIEHPSMFVCPFPDTTECPGAGADDNKAVEPQHKKAPASLRRSQRRSAHQAASAIAMQTRNSNHFKRVNNDVMRRNNKGFQKMRQILQQPRKRC